MTNFNSLINRNNRLISDGDTGIQLTHALDYARRGWHVFPINHRGRPHVRNLLEKATTDPKVISKWWKKHPLANIGLLTGPKSGFWVLEVDNLNEFFEELPLDYGSPTYLPRDLIALSLHGQAQMYFQWDDTLAPEYCNSFKGMKVIGNGSYVIAPPSYYADQVDDYFAFKWNPNDSIPVTPDWVRKILAVTSTHPTPYYGKICLPSEGYDYRQLYNSRFSEEERLLKYARYLSNTSDDQDDVLQEMNQVVCDLDYLLSEETVNRIFERTYGLLSEGDVDALKGEEK